MSRLIPRTRRGAAAALMLCVVVGVLAALFMARRADAAPYTNPFWANASASPESPVDMVADLSLETENVRCGRTCGTFQVDVRTGELFWTHQLFRTPGVVEDNRFALRWRSMLSGRSQVGRQMVPSWETTVQYVVVNQQNPAGPGGHQVVVRRPTGRIDVFGWDGATYLAPPGVLDSLAPLAGGTYMLTDRWGNRLTFDVRGMPATFEDRNGNEDLFVYNAAFQLVSMTDDRGKSYTIGQNASGYISSISDACGRAWTLSYDANDNLTSIKTPSTADQPLGITTTLNYDGANRLTSITDGRGNTEWQIAYNGGSGQVASVTVGANAVQYSYASGVTTRTDRNGNVFRHYYTGNQVTKADMLVGGQAAYSTLFRYNGAFLANVVLPRGNRVDITLDSAGNLTERRHRTQDTSTADPSDLVHTWAYSSSFLSTYTDPNGNVWSFTRDVAGNLTQITHPTATNPTNQLASKSYTYNGQGQVVSVTDEEGNTTNYSYYAAGSSAHLLEKINVDPNGLNLESSFTYDCPGNIATQTDPNGNVTNLSWDNLRRLTNEQPPAALGYETKYTYDAAGNLTVKEVKNIDKDGNVVVANPWWTTTLAYDNLNDRTSVTEEIDAATTRTVSFEYDANQNRVRVTKPEGNKEAWEYNERDWVIKHIRGETDPKESSVQYFYDENGNQTTITDGRSNSVTKTYDLFDRHTRTTDPLGNYSEWELDKNGNVTKATRHDSTATQLLREDYFYDERNRLWKVSALHENSTTTKADAVTTLQHRKTGELSTLTNARSKVTSHVYDAARRLVSVSDAMGNTWDWTLDSNGNPTGLAFTEKDGATDIVHDYESTYDELNRRKTFVEIDRTDSNNRLTREYHYNSRSNRVFAVNAEGNPTRWTYSGIDRVLKAERAISIGSSIDDFTGAHVTTWEYDSNGRTTKHKDDALNQTSWSYDALDRATTMTFPDNGTVTHVYDLNDNVVKTTDPAGNVIDDTYDVLNRNTSRTVTRATGVLGTTSETRTFDAANRMSSTQDGDYRVEFEYESIGFSSRVHKETQSYVGMTAYAKTVTTTYDANGNPTNVTYPTGANLTVGYVYNDIDRMTAITDTTNNIATYGWAGFRKKSEGLQNGATTANTYAGFRSEITSIDHQTSGSQTIARFDYAHNKVHDPLFERFGASGASGDGFTYDKLRRLTAAWMGSSTPSSPNGNAYVTKQDYNYDGDANRSSVVTTPYQQTSTTSNYVKNNLYEYSSVGGTSRVHDANGNLTDDGTNLYLYDYRNQLVQLKRKSDGVVLASYRYDALGRRVEKNTGDVERYIRTHVGAPGTMANLSHVVAVYDDSDNWLQNYVWNDEVDGVVMLEQADVLDYDSDADSSELTRSYYHRNALGSVMEITDASENVVVSYRYDPYGAVTITRGGNTQTTDPLGQHWTFTGRFLDEESGLYYYRARHYDVETGRFLQRDPLGYGAGPNLYGYVSARPTRSLDPTGLETVDVKTMRKSTKNYNQFVRITTTRSSPEREYGEWYLHEITSGHLGFLWWITFEFRRKYTDTVHVHEHRETTTVPNSGAMDRLAQDYANKQAKNSSFTSEEEFFIGKGGTLVGYAGDKLASTQGRRRAADGTYKMLRRKAVGQVLAKVGAGVSIFQDLGYITEKVGNWYFDQRVLEAMRGAESPMHNEDDYYWDEITEGEESVKITIYFWLIFPVAIGVEVDECELRHRRTRRRQTPH